MPITPLLNGKTLLQLGYQLAVGGDPQDARTESCWLSSHWSGDRVVNDLQHITLALTQSNGKSDRPNPINRLVMSSLRIYMFYPDLTFKSALAASSRHYFLVARRRWLRVNCVEGKEIWTGVTRCRSEHFFCIMLNMKLN